MENTILQNDLIKLRPMQLHDAEAIYTVSNDERIWEHIAYDLLTLEAVEKYVQTQVNLMMNGARIPFVIIDKITNKIIGSTSIYDISLEHAHCEIGATWLAPNYWRTSVNTNCKFLLLQHAFEERNLERVQLKTDNLNKRSQEAIERLGAKFEGKLRSHMRRKDGSMRDTMLYSIVKEEWPEIKMNLQATIDEHEDR